MNGSQYFESTKTSSEALATRIWKKREGEIAMGLFKIGSAGKMSFAELCQEFERSHVPTLSVRTQTNVKIFLNGFRAFFGDRKLSEIDTRLIEDYRNHRRQQKSQNNPNRTVKGATVNRELAYLRCLFGFATSRGHFEDNPARGVKYFDERRDRAACTDG